MASAWGSAWGAAWANAWGLLTGNPPAVGSGANTTAPFTQVSTGSNLGIQGGLKLKGLGAWANTDRAEVVARVSSRTPVHHLTRTKS